MTQEIFEIISNRRLAEGLYELCLAGNTDALTAPGQFVNIKLEGRFLRRPISVCYYTEGMLALIYKVVGVGTKQLQNMQPGQTLDLLVGLGNGFDVSKSGDEPLLIGGGVGAAPLFGLCRELTDDGKRVSVALGFNRAEEMYYYDQFSALGATVLVATADGSLGVKGFVTDLIKNLDYSYFYTCGPMPMLEAVNAVATTEGQLSFEERMGCGFGACMGCSCKTLTGSKRICRDGPVLERKEILWPTHA